MIANTRKLFLVLATMLASTALLLILFPPREPTFEGRSLTSWLEEWGKCFGPPGTPFRPEPLAEARNAIEQMGGAAVPLLRKMLRTRDTSLRQKVVMFCSKRPWIPIHFRPPAKKLQNWAMFGIRT